MLLQMALFHSFYGWVILHCVCVRVCVHTTSSLSIHLSMDMSLLSWLMLLWAGAGPPFLLELCLDARPGVRLLILWQLYFGFIEESRSVFYSGCSGIQSHPQCRTAPFSHPPLRLFVDFWWRPLWPAWGGPPCSFALRCLIISKVGSIFFMCLLAISVSSLKKRLFRSSAHFWLGWLLFFILSSMSCLHILEIHP